jgi:lysophospholipase L1-like esterase
MGLRSRIVTSRSANLIVLLVSLVIAAIVAEVVLARLFPQPTMDRILADAPRIFSESDLLPYDLAPGSEDTHVTREFETPIRINSLGYRDDEFDVAKGGRFRILVIGDSFTFGYGCTGDEAYPNVMEARLNGAGGRFEVINAGFAACNYPDTYYLYLKERGLALDPDLIIVGLFAGNDLDHDLAHEHAWPRVDDAGLPLRIENTLFRVDEGYWVSRTRVLRYRLPVVRNSHLAQLLVSALKRTRRGGAPMLFNRWIYRREYADRTLQVVEKVENLLAATAGLAEERGIPIVFVIIPAREQVYPERYDFSRYPFMDGHDLDKPQRILKRFLDDRGLVSFDLLPTFREASGDASLYYDVDQHWNGRGHALAGRAIADSLAARGVVPAVGP